MGFRTAAVQIATFLKNRYPTKALTLLHMKRIMVGNPTWVIFAYSVARLRWQSHVRSLLGMLKVPIVSSLDILKLKISMSFGIYIRFDYPSSGCNILGRWAWIRFNKSPYFRLIR